MAKYLVTSGTIPAPVKVVLYGPEGIGKSTFASQFPDPVFIDTEGGTKRLNVARLPAPTSWQMLMDEVAEVARSNVPCGTLVIDTADWAEKLCMEGVCAKYKVNSIEAFNYIDRQARKTGACLHCPWHTAGAACVLPRCFKPRKENEK